MNGIKKIIFLFAVISFCISAGAQGIMVNSLADNGREIPLKQDTKTRIKSFSGKQINDTTYLVWKVQDMRQNGIFMIYRSDDGETFNIIGTKKAIGVPVHNEIAYYAQDIHPSGLIKYYRIFYVSETSEYLASDKLLMNDDGKSLATTSQDQK